MRVRLGLAALSNGHFDNALVPLRTPHDDYLPRYARRFDVLELAELYHDATPGPHIQQWAAQAPRGFTFPAKLWKKAVDPRGTLPGLVDKPVEWDDEALAMSRLALAAQGVLGPARGPVVAQFPPRFTHTPARLAWLDRLLRLPARWCVELRHPSWWREDVRSLLDDRGAPLVWSTFDTAPSPDWDTADFGYVRFTGTARPRRGRAVAVRDREEDVRRLCRRIAQATWTECLVIVTNGFEGNAIDSLPKVAHALGGSWPRRVARGPAAPLLPD